MATNLPRRLARLAERLVPFLTSPSDEPSWPHDQIGPRQRPSADDARRRAAAFLDERRQAAKDLIANH